MTVQDPHTGDSGRHRQHLPTDHVRGDHPVGASTDPSMGFGTSPEDRLHLPETPLDAGKRTGSTLWLLLAIALVAALVIALVVSLL